MHQWHTYQVYASVDVWQRQSCHLRVVDVVDVVDVSTAMFPSEQLHTETHSSSQGKPTVRHGWWMAALTPGGPGSLAASSSGTAASSSAWTRDHSRSASAAGARRSRAGSSASPLVPRRSSARRRPCQAPQASRTSWVASCARARRRRWATAASSVRTPAASALQGRTAAMRRSCALPRPVCPFSKPPAWAVHGSPLVC